MILLVLTECLCFTFCGIDSNDAQRNGHEEYHIPAQPESHILEQGSIVQLFCKIHNSSVELKEIMLEKADDGVAFDIRAKSFLRLDDCLLMRKRGFDGYFVFNEGTCEMTNTTLNIERRNDNCELMKSLAKMEGEDASLLVRNSEWRNIVFCGSGSILRNGEGSFEGIKNCVFSNITMKFMKEDEMPNEKVPMMKMSSIEDCQVESSMNVLEGGIVSGTEGSVAFSCNNCTFLHNERVDWRVGNTERNSTTQTQTYKNAEWNECSAPCGGALYVHDNSNATLTVENSSFVKCNATSTRGGGIFAFNIAECTVRHSTFIECYCVASTTLGGAGAEIQGMTIQVFFENCFFKDGWSGDDAGGLGIWSSKANKTKDCVLDCSFMNCSGHHPSSSGGGGLITWYPIDKIVAKNCLFQRCYSARHGGAVSVLTNGYNGNLLWFCFFHNNSAPQGNDICIYDNSTDSQLVLCYSTRTEGVRYYAGGDKSEWLPNNGGKCRFVASTQNQTNAKDTFSCGLNESCACLTISHCLSQMIVGFVEEMKVLSGTVVEGKGVDIGEKTISVNGALPSGSVIETKFEANGLSLLCVGTGELSVNDLSVVHNTSLENNRRSRLFEVKGAGGINLERMNISMDAAHSEERSIQNSLVKMDGGSLKMKDVRWSQTFSTTSVISLPQEATVSLTLDNCTFNNIVRTTAGSSLMNVGEGSHSITFDGCTIDGCGSEASEFGGGVMVEVGNVGSLKMNGGVVKNCYALAAQGRGGGIGLKVKDTNAEFLISSGFEGNRAKWGSDIFVDSIDLETTAKSERIACLTASLDSFDKVTGYDKGNTSLAIPLCIYLLPTPEEIYVSNIETSDHSHCGIVQFPCLTMKHSLTRQTGTKKIVVEGMIMISDELAFSEQKHEIRGNDDESGWTVSDASSTSNSAMITTSVETELSKLIFSLPPSFSSHSTFISSSSQLTLSHCSLSLQDPLSELTFLFLSVEYGTLTVESFSASSITLNGNPLISLCGSGLNAELMSSKWLNMTKNNFTEIERAVGSGGCVSIDNSNDENEDSNGEINIEECEFDGCSVLADESRGGAINAQLKGSIQMNVISCTFTGCTAPAEEGKTGFGGGMALKLIDEYSSFVISSPVFDLEKPNVAKYGNDLFVESSNLTKSITNTSLPFVSEHLDGISLNSMRGFDGSDTTNAVPLVYFWFALGSEIFVGGEGRDMGACGFSDYPCLSIDYSLDRLPEGNEKNINIIEKAILQKSVDVSGITMKSNDNNKCSLECVSSLEGAEGAAMKICGITSFELIMFVIPSSFTSGVNYLMHVGSSEGLLTLKDCSFTKNEESKDGTINFGLIKADKGTVKLELVSMQSLCFSKDVISVLPTTILNIKNLTMKNIELEGASGLSISKSSGREKNEAEQDVVIEWSVCEEVTQNTTDDIPIIRNDNDDEPLKIVIRNTTMKKCGGTRCGKGGGMFCVLNEGGSFDCSFCTISECFCSTTGRGGWLFLECTSLVEKPLNFVLSNITFKDNSAFRGRDVYVRCHSIETQIVAEQFLLDFRTPFVKDLAIWGCTTDSFVGEEDLLLRVVKYQSETIFVSSATGNHGDSKQCGEFKMPCHSLDVGVQHIIPSSYSQLLISEETIINGECDVHDVIIRSLESPSTALVHLNSTININECNLLTTSEKVRIESVKFNFDQSFSYSGSSLIHEASGQLSLSFVDFSSVGGSNNNQLVVVLNSTLVSIAKGILHVDNCSVSLLSFMKPSFLLNGDEVSFTNMKLGQIESTRNVVEIGQCRNVVLNGIDANGVKLSEGCILSIGSLASGSVSVGSSSFKNCSRNSEGASILSTSSTSTQISLSNCSCSNCYSLSSKGSMMEMNNANDVLMDSCRFEGMILKESESGRKNSFEEICEWNGSLVHSTNSSLVMKDVTILNASSGGLSISSGNVKIEAGNFSNNNPANTKYPSLRRNIICSDSASLSISSLKGGDGFLPNSSLWALNEGCSFEGIASERDSSFFIPVLESIEAKESTDRMKLTFKGMLLIPCNLSFSFVKRKGEEKEIEKHDFDSNGFLSEREVEGSVGKDLISSCGSDIEVSVLVLFGNAESPTSTNSFILKNASEAKVNGEGKLVEGGKEGKSYLLLIVIIMAFVLLIILIVSIILAVRWRKQKRRTEELEEIVNDTVKKDPKLIEMVTMEMSPEAQWRRAEREAEKKNDERMKKRIYDTNMEHSESSEHLLSESGSTEYILGKDSDKIPDWALEKVEEEEIRKQTPSPSISSTCSTDSDSTFVRSESLCPTTSSMSNLVDAMACSSPHEKLIVDLRDSLFMLLHGLNKTKEMAIGTLKEREQTAAQILFWVANLALHSFDEMENPLQSLSNLSPHIVLFSEHMVICIVMHSDLLSDDDSDSSSISSSTVVTSASGNDDDDSLPSSAFEDEDSFKKECLKWKAPELQMNKKMGATKESVSFSIGMMLWECLTLQIPFGEYEAEVAGQKIVNGERPSMKEAEESVLLPMILSCLSSESEKRLSLQGLKREFIQRFPEGAVMLTMSDAVIYIEDSEQDGSCQISATDR
ncbi:uncharacterized protein MONOS_12421 [Monocercomonoides exilis]|uniref:uncharacterized protein n=1 Tax=Monocercomonoides exilis TaxID=2049356 RepID=UPI00355A8A78|nr:hypothetical protein MONOS_12421 [Monocercomonoides exilis]|eukprot:MONOS_12421.1-p1 / transcript=MONOS_12421.1 / gene=MONOS_12421 / organism=Monocercomonoides_exilis_PA203 / gene_product=unspecified product / transcript_product=unspecified product / location=Mono_scaffold00687:12282-19922(+) / protein_length=2546 / sequence_SO=supercontig / SO=protein_coding / is_pseudo=false